MDWYNDYNFVDFLLYCVCPFAIISAGVVVGAIITHLLDVKWERDFKKEKEEYKKSETYKKIKKMEKEWEKEYEILQHDPTFISYKQDVAESNWRTYWYHKTPYE